MVNDQGAKRLLIVGNFEDLSQLKTTRSLRVHPCANRDEQSQGLSARTVYRTAGLTLFNKLKSRDRSKDQSIAFGSTPGFTRIFF